MFLLEQQSTVILPLTMKIRSILAEILELSFSGLLAERFLRAKVTELLCHTAQCLLTADQKYNDNDSLPAHKSTAIKNVVQIVEADIVNPPGLNELARSAGMSRSTLLNTFKVSYGLSVSNYLLQRRMEKAQSLLKTRTLSVLEVALLVGYENPSSFGRVYERY